MPMFLRGKIAVTAAGVVDLKDIDPAVDTIFIREAMPYGVVQRVIGAATTIQINQQQRAARRNGAPPTTSQRVDIGDYQIAFLIQNILDWHGPSFTGVPCTPENIEALNPKDPTVQMVLKEIGERNATEAEPDDGDGGDGDDPNVIEIVPVQKKLSRTTSGG